MDAGQQQQGQGQQENGQTQQQNGSPTFKLVLVGDGGTGKVQNIDTININLAELNPYRQLL